MKKVQTTVTSPRPPEEVYAYLADFGNQPEWRFDVLESRLVGGEAGRTGARYHQRVKPGRKEMASEVELTKADAHRAVAFRTVDEAPVTASGEWQISPEGRGSRVVCDVAIEAHGLVRLFEPFMGPSLRRTAKRYEAALEARLSGSA